MRKKIYEVDLESFYITDYRILSLNNSNKFLFMEVKTKKRIDRSSISSNFKQKRKSEEDIYMLCSI